MAIYSLLQEITDVRKGGNEATFNGYLEDYLGIIGEDGKHYDLFSQLFELDNDLRIITDYRVGINETTISNQIIRYKDIFKLKNKPLVCPYIIYTKQDDKEKAILLTDDHFIYIKGLYYTMTEPNGALQDVKNELIVMTLEKNEDVIDVFNRIFKAKAGALQREIDRKHYQTYELAQQEALRLSNDLKDHAIDNISACPQDEKEELINSYIIKWFLLKKYLYVQYMINKDILTKVHDGNVKKQRNQAKINADEIKFLSLSEMWRTRKKEENE